MLWLQGWNTAPEVAQACLKTWQTHNPNWTIHALGREDLHHYLDEAELSSLIAGKNIPPESLSDIIRIMLLQRYGGVWADSTLYCLKPLDSWLPEFTSSGFFAFAKPGADRMLSSWFIAGVKGNYILRDWHRRVVAYWSERTQRHHYFWFHYLFPEGYSSDPHFRRIWDSTPELLAAGPHHYLPPGYKRLRAQVSSTDVQFLASPPTPVLKLTNKFALENFDRNSVLRHLCNQADQAWQRGTSIDLQNDFSTPRRLLVAWYGSFDGHGTIGDLHAMQSVVTHLVGHGHDVFHASTGDITIIGSQKIDWRVVSPEAFHTLIFVCGPILKRHPMTRELFEAFESIPKIGVSVSLFPPENLNHIDPFDEVLAREGKPEQYHDVAIVAPDIVPRPKRKEMQPPTIGIVLRGQQAEYGKELCFWEQTAQLAKEVAETLIKRHGGRVIFIENHLRRSGVTAKAIEAMYAECTLIITSRFHGAMMALRHNIPFIAIDQIQGGAKVLRLVGATGWPYVYDASTIDSTQLIADASELLTGRFDKTLADVSTRAIKAANVTLIHLAKIVSELPSHPLQEVRSFS
jgi:hypothetical protein